MVLISTRHLIESTLNRGIILNTPISSNHDLIHKLFESTQSIYCADGGANRLRSHSPKRIPNLIIGDLDSVLPATREYYTNLGVEIIHDPDQDSTDLGKALNHLFSLPTTSTSLPSTTNANETSTQSKTTENNVENIIIFGGLSGRLDQTVHTINTLFKLTRTHPQRRVWVIGKESLAIVLPPGKHTVQMCHEYFGQTCGILPLEGETKVSTKGLKWDVGPGSFAYPTSMITSVSSSNHLLPEVEYIGIECDRNIIWTAEVKGGAD